MGELLECRLPQWSRKVQLIAAYRTSANPRMCALPPNRTIQDIVALSLRPSAERENVGDGCVSRRQRACGDGGRLNQFGKPNVPILAQSVFGFSRRLDVWFFFLDDEYVSTPREAAGW